MNILQHIACVLFNHYCDDFFIPCKFCLLLSPVFLNSTEKDEFYLYPFRSSHFFQQIQYKAFRLVKLNKKVILDKNIILVNNFYPITNS